MFVAGVLWRIRCFMLLFCHAYRYLLLHTKFPISWLFYIISRIIFTMVIFTNQFIVKGLVVCTHKNTELIKYTQVYHRFDTVKIITTEVYHWCHTGTIFHPDKPWISACTCYKQWVWIAPYAPSLINSHSCPLVWSMQLFVAFSCVKYVTYLAQRGAPTDQIFKMGPKQDPNFFI